MEQAKVRLSDGLLSGMCRKAVEHSLSLRTTASGLMYRKSTYKTLGHSKRSQVLLKPFFGLN